MTTIDDLVTGHSSHSSLPGQGHQARGDPEPGEPEAHGEPGMLVQ